MKYKYPFTNALTFALVMEDPILSRGLLQLRCNRGMNTISRKEAGMHMGLWMSIT